MKDLTLKDWANQEMKSHGKSGTFQEWLSHEVKKHGNIKIKDWGQDEIESHTKRYLDSRNAEGFHMAESDYEESYDEMLDEMGAAVLSRYSVSRMLRETDPIAYDVGMNDYESSLLADHQEDPEMYSEMFDEDEELTSEGEKMLKEMYDEMLDESGVESLLENYDASKILKETDPIAYRVGLSDYESSMEEDDMMAETFGAEYSKCDECGSMEQGKLANRCDWCEMDMCKDCADGHFEDVMVRGVCPDSLNGILEESSYISYQRKNETFGVETEESNFGSVGEGNNFGQMRAENNTGLKTIGAIAVGGALGAFALSLINGMRMFNGAKEDLKKSAEAKRSRCSTCADSGSMRKTHTQIMQSEYSVGQINPVEVEGQNDVHGAEGVINPRHEPSSSPFPYPTKSLKMW